MASSLNRKVISRDGVKDSRARTAFRLTEENFVQLFDEAKRQRFWVNKPASYSKSFLLSAGTGEKIQTFSVSTTSTTGKPLRIYLAPTSAILTFDTGAGIVAVPQSASITFGTVNTAAQFFVTLLRDGVAIAELNFANFGTTTPGGASGSFSQWHAPSVFSFVDDAPGGVQRTYQLQWSVLTLPTIPPPTTPSVSVSISGCMMCAEEIF
ncbi:MAG: hypothetical protein HC841_00250 [Verrucomicrobiae bacterium]|nr:hypothetical protein [Verrucomicrobiae bacterium]